MVLSAPTLSRNGQNVQLSYETSFRINSVSRYPIQSPNGSDVYIYGTENGVRIIWRGGRSFKTDSAPPTSTTKPNGGNPDTVMILDSDDEDSSEPSFEDKPEFEDEIEEFDQSHPYPQILQHIDLPLSTSVQSISVPLSLIHSSASGPAPKQLENKIVFAAACADNLVRLIVLPIIPPSPSSKARDGLRKSSTSANAGNGKWGEVVICLSGHPVMVDRVSITFTASKAEAADKSSTDRSESQTRAKATDEWNIVVASCSRAVSGLLLLHRFPIQSSKAGLVAPKSNLLPFQTQYLPSPAVSISFNPLVSSASRSTHLLLADKSGACKIYDCEPLSMNPEMPNSFATQGGSWLLTLLPSFQSNQSAGSPGPLSSTTLSNYGRKSIVDAKWTLAGRAIIVLLADGEWGVWDVEGAQPGSQKGILGRSSMKGGAITKFCISGWVEGAPVKSMSRSTTQQVSGKFAPMTPGARKVVEPTLFSGRTGHGTAQGSISVARLPGSSTSAAAEECIVMWLEDSLVMIPNLTAFWDAQRNKSSGGGNLFRDGKPGSRLVRIKNVNLHGQKICGIEQSVVIGLKIKTGFPSELHVIGEHRLTIVSDASLEQISRTATTTGHELSDSQALVTKTGLLDVGDIDAELDRMDQTPVRGRKGVAFLA